jgi:hypothetical protein
MNIGGVGLTGTTHLYSSRLTDEYRWDLKTGRFLFSLPCGTSHFIPKHVHRNETPPPSTAATGPPWLGFLISLIVN